VEVKTITEHDHVDRPIQDTGMVPVSCIGLSTWSVVPPYQLLIETIGNIETLLL